MADKDNETGGSKISKKILELFSGIGGMRYAAQEWASRNPDREVHVVKAFDVNSLANSVYAFNFGDQPSPKSIEHLTAAELDALHADTDARARALLHLCEVLPAMKCRPSFILLENVKNFEVSRRSMPPGAQLTFCYVCISHRLWMSCLTSCGYSVRQFLLSPPQMCIPNERLRYYCLARLHPNSSWQPAQPEDVQTYFPHLPSLPSLPTPPIPTHNASLLRDDATAPSSHHQHTRGAHDGSDEEDADAATLDGTVDAGSERAYVDLISKRAAFYEHCRPISEFMEDASEEQLARFMVKDTELQKWKGYVFDIVTPDSKRCSCFTKSYCKFVRGTGSVLSSNFYDECGRCLLALPNPWCVQDLDMMKSLKLRYFSPREVANLLGFPRESFSFPQDYKPLACYKLLGNSLCVSVVSALLEHLYAD